MKLDWHFWVFVISVAAFGGVFMLAVLQMAVGQQGDAAMMLGIAALWILSAYQNLSRWLK